MVVANKRRELRTLATLPGYEPEIGRLLWTMEDARARTKACVVDIPAELIDWTPRPGVNSIGALLYHIAAIELDWLMVDVLEAQTFPPEMMALFPENVRDEQGQLATARGQTLETHFARLDAVRELLLKSFEGMTVEEFRRARLGPKYDVTPEWVLQYLPQHEGGHRGEISLMRGLASPAVP